MDTTFSQAAWLIPLFPLAAFLLLLAFGRSSRMIGVLLGSVSSLAGFVLSLLVLIEHMTKGQHDYQYAVKWIDTGSIVFKAGFEVTNLTALMLVVVTAVSFLVNVYSAGYMKGDERISVFYSYVALFTFSMLGLVLADNMLTLYVFWELVGVCSFLLVGFWFSKPEARAAAKKAFIVTRIGDAGLLLGILLLYWYMPDHALDFVRIGNAFEGGTGVIAASVTTWIAILIFIGAVGKSGQFPLHVWLPDAMEGPTPISALIHAATMVAAGVYLVARTFDIFQASQTAMDIVAYIGGFTAIFAATIGVAQNDIKRILAYSTVSQLGYMMMALGLNSMTGGIFHLFTHAFFKALLFLGAGSVIHAVHTQNIQEMGGLGSKMKITAWTFGIGALALSGIPPFSGFWSKDMILNIAYHEKPALFVIGVVAAFFTAFYMARLFFLVFMGKPKGERHAHESPPSMTGPLIVLAVLAVVAGFVQTPWNDTLGNWLTDGAEQENGGGGLVMVISAAIGLLGLYMGWLVFVKGMISRDFVSSRAPWLVRLLERKYYIDELYEAAIVRPLRALGGLLNGIDDYVVDGLVRAAGGAAFLIGRGGTRMQNGQVQTYGLITAFALVILIAAVALRRFW
ncbi:NADH-quinone oxidoreductase subunit L [Paenibacillus sacheonensis]|uniref:NADH-quinone oxidoreductase subunit L n=1 Tax=Paenibacillus sacheonensis TaxID=742054 RepID=A0A7X5C5K1_9BACL|nr:NADH-quinone oxidoreductase subunit L [Paenibacillus sacheonensis]MBM7566517.1 NADH-quinone oxidoreductase subunit L [Paenibacillus sacheonensis]NBC73474.1 NADH-quinone oxidoreductase subunit L [Paenibacillus sacheonensis]